MTAPPPPESLRLVSGDVSLAAYDWGNADAPPLVLVHGIQDFALSLAPLADALRDRFRVLAYDLRGHGESDKPGVYTLPHHLADLHAVVLQLGLERPVLVGHSLGGQIVSQYAGIFPDVPARVVSIEGLGPPFADFQMPPDVEQWRTRVGIESLLQTGGGGRPMQDLEDALQLFCRYHPRIAVETARRLVELGTEPHPHGGLRWKWDPRVQTTWLSVSPAQTQRRWSWAECPVLLITGGLAHEFWSRNRGLDADDGRIDPGELARRVRLFRDARHVEIEDAGHMVHYDAPDRLASIVREFVAD